MIEAPAGALTGPVAILSDAHVVREGVLGMLPPSWRDRAIADADPHSLPHDRPLTLILDGDTEAAEAALHLADRHGWSTVLLLGTRTHARTALANADAVLGRDELEPAALRLALAATRAGVQVLSPGLAWHTADPDHQARSHPALSEASHRVLALLAEGKRDAEIAIELSVSESAVRKLVQRTVQAVGARTRAQAVAIVSRPASP